jgi:cytochrome P450
MSATVDRPMNASGHAADLRVFDIFDSDHAQRKWEILGYAREHCPVFRTEAMGGMWVATRHEHVRHVLENPQVFSSSIPSVYPSPVPLPPIDLDPPLHADFRKFLNPYMSRSYLLKFEPKMRAIAADAMNGFIERGVCEFNRDFAVPVASHILARVIFDEDNEERMARALDAATRMGLENTPDTFFDMAMVAAEFLVEREQDGQDRDDLLGALLRATVENGRPLTERERIGAITILFIGGLDTTRAAMGNIVLNMARDPALEGRVRDPAWIRSDMDEFLRYESPVTCLGRVVTQDTDLGDVRLRAGDRLLAHFASANRDDARYERAGELDFGLPRAGNAAFGLGVHRCVGANLARLTLTVAFHELLSQITNIRLLEEPRTTPGIVHHPEQLHIGFDRIGSAQ